MIKQRMAQVLDLSSETEASIQETLQPVAQISNSMADLSKIGAANQGNLSAPSVELAQFKTSQG